jgi:hypothetical protein
MAMAGMGLRQEEISLLLGHTAKTVRRHYRHELTIGSIEANLRVARSLYNLAVKEGNVSACIWWTKARMGWKEQADVNVGGTGEPVRYEFVWGDALPNPKLATNPAAPVIDGEASTTEPDQFVVEWQKPET